MSVTSSYVSYEMSLSVYCLKNLNSILVTLSLKEEVSLAAIDHVSSQALKIFIPGIQNASCFFFSSFSSWEHYYLHAVKCDR